MPEAIGYKRLIIWKKADELVLTVYILTSQFPKSEIYSLTSQLRRAVVSIPTNIVEGYARNSKGEFRRFISIALGSLAEVQYLIELSNRLKYLKGTDCLKTIQSIEELGRILWKFYQTLC